MNTSLMIFSYIYLGILALAVGSFLNVVIYRLPLMLKAVWLADCQALLQHDTPSAGTNINLATPRSFCPACKKPIKILHNLPLISFMLLKGRCAQCNHPIPWRYPGIELLTFSLSLLAAGRFGFTWELVFALLFIWFLIPLFFIDLTHQFLPDGLTISLLWLGLFANTKQLFTSLPDAVFSAAGAYLFLWLFIKIYYWITGKIGMGNGDFKLFAALGAWFGWTVLPLILLAASFTGAVTGILYLKWAKKNLDTQIAFGPFLCIAGMIALFLKDPIIKSYLALF